MIYAILLAVLLHPGHKTRIEIRQSDQGDALEVAMQIDTTDLESALKRRLKSSIDVDSLTDKEAKTTIRPYLVDTIRIGHHQEQKPDLSWIGWQKHPRHVWIFFELSLPSAQVDDVELTINTLLEVEPELQHIVVLDKNLGDRTLIVTGNDKPITLGLSRRPVLDSRGK